MADKPEIRTCVFYDPDAAKDKESEYGCMGQFRVTRSDSPYCPRCRANMGYWQRSEKKRPGSMRRYRNKLACRHARLDEWSGVTHAHTRGKVVSLQVLRKRRNG